MRKILCLLGHPILRNFKVKKFENQEECVAILVCKDCEKILDGFTLYIKPKIKEEYK